MAQGSSSFVTFTPLDKKNDDLRIVSSINKDAHIRVKKVVISSEVIKTCDGLAHMKVATCMLLT